MTRPAGRLLQQTPPSFFVSSQFPPIQKCLTQNQQDHHSMARTSHPSRRWSVPANFIVHVVFRAPHPQERQIIYCTSPSRTENNTSLSHQSEGLSAETRICSWPARAWCTSSGRRWSPSVPCDHGSPGG